MVLSLQVDNVGRLLANMSRQTDKSQALREFFENARNAIDPSAGPATIRFEWVYVDGVRKLAITDTGCGMSGDELVALIGSLAASATYSGSSRFGVGAKIAGLHTSPWGVEYITWNGTDAPARAILANRDGNPGFIALSARKAVARVKKSDLPTAIAKAGHGTQVILHGALDTEDSVEAITRYAAQTKRASADTNLKSMLVYLNDRYIDLPTGIDAKVEVPRSTKDPLRAEARAVTGLRHVVDTQATDKGTWVSADGELIVNWYVTPKEASKRYKHGGHCSFRSTVAVGLRSEEDPQVLETYDLRTAQAGFATLSRFGLSPISNQVTLLCEYPDAPSKGIGTNMERTGLVRIIGDIVEPVDVANYGEEFADTMPERLAELVSDALAANDVTEEMFRQLAEFPELFDGDFINDLTKDLLAGMFGTARDRASGTTAGTARGNRIPTGAGNTAAEQDAAKAEPKARTPKADDDIEETSKSKGKGGVVMPRILDWIAEDDDVALFARWDPTQGVLYVNDAAPVIDDETREFCNSKDIAPSSPQWDNVRGAVKFTQTFQALETVLRAPTLLKGDALNAATSPEAITLAVSCRIQRRHALALRAKSFGVRG